jgi:hypothetical protein
MAHMALAPANLQSDTQLNAGGNLGSAAGTWKGLNVSPQLTAVSPYASTLHAVYGNGTLIVPSGASGITQGLNFTAIAAGQGAVTEMQALWVKLATSLSFTGTITKAAALHAPSPLFLGAKPTANYGLLVEPVGATGMTDAIGALIDAPANATNNYTIWAGAPITGTPRLRLDAGTPGTNQTLLWLAEGTSPTLRRVQWKQFQLLSALDKVMILV